MASSSDRSSRPGGSASWPGGGNSKPGGGVTVSRPGRYLVVLAALIIVMLLSVVGGALAHPSAWHTKFKVGLGLDLHGGTQFTIDAIAPGNKTPTSGQMTQSIAILVSRVNGQGFTGATVQQQGSSIIVVSVPGKGAETIAPLLKSAVLRFRQVLLEAPGYPTSLLPPTAPTPSPTATPSPGTSASPSPSSSAKSTPSASGSAKPSASPKPSGGTGQAVGSLMLAGAAASPSPSASAKPSQSATPTSSPSPTPSPTPIPTPTTRLPTAADAQGNVSMVHSAAAIRDFNRLNCRVKDWQKQIYGDNPNSWDNPNAQIVACDSHGFKYVLDVAKVQGRNLRNVAALLDPTNNQWVVTFNLDSAGRTAFGTMTTQMYTSYFDPTTQTPKSVLDQFAIVLDGQVVSAPDIVSPITTGSGQINGGAGAGFTQAYANQLANVLKYGAVPLAFVPQSTNSVSAQLGSEQLDASLIAAGVGMLLVIAYSFIYYRGLALVSVLSLATAALLAWLSVVLLSSYEGYTLSLAGVAGLIVAIGITADSFVVFFERLRDEVREGRSLRAAVERGWGRARRTILVSDTVSFLAALLLYIFAISDVRGFAYTLGLTTLIDVVVVFLFTKPMVTLLARTKFYGLGHKWSGLDPARLGARSPWRGSRPATARPATGGATSASAPRTTPREA